MNLLLSCFLAISQLTFLFKPLIQEEIAFNDVTVFYQYGEQVTFQANITSTTPIQDLMLFIQPAGQGTQLEQVALSDSGGLVYQYPIQQNPLRPFSTIDYWFRGHYTSGNEFSSGVYSFIYEDNRLEWQTLDSGLLQVRWAQGNLEFGQTVLNVAQNSLKSNQTYLPVELETPVRIYVYSNASDLQSAAQLGQLSWVAGHTSPDLGTVLISIPDGPSAQIELERQLPHELMHIMEYQVVKDSYSTVPNWLLEGLASLAELYPNVDYQRTLKKAAESNSLFSISALCTSFPQDASSAFLAYAESASFVRFLHQKYGATGMMALLTQYTDGLGCSEGVEKAYSVTLNQLEYRWQQESLGMNTTWLVFENLSPFLILLLVLLIPLIITIIIWSVQKRKSASFFPQSGPG